jgi:hypothetical protein
MGGEASSLLHKQEYTRTQLHVHPGSQPPDSHRTRHAIARATWVQFSPSFLASLTGLHRSQA